MKTNIYLLVFSLLATLFNAKAQDYKKMFFNLPSQPNIDNVTSVGASDEYISILVDFSISTTKYAYLRVYDGNSWFSTDTFVYTGMLNRVLSYKNAFYIAGKFSTIDGKSAPMGQCISLLGLKNNVWDSLNNCLLPDSINLKAATSNDEGIYMHSESSKKLSELFLLSPSNGLINKYQVVTNMPSYASLFISANAKRFAAYPNAGSLVSVNGNSVGKLFVISNGSVSSPSLNGGNMLSASVDVNGDIIYNTDAGPVMNRWDGSSSKNIAFNLGTKVFGAIPVTCTDSSWFLPGIINGTTNTLYVLDKNGNTWYTIQLYKTRGWVVHSKNLGTFNADNKTFLVSRLEKAASIYGTLFHDKDSDCVKGNGENGIAFQYVSFKDEQNKYETLSDENGDYYIPVPEGKFEFGKIPAHLHIGSCTLPSDSIHKGETDTINIPARGKRERELDIILIPGTRRWGDPSVQTILVRNLGNASRTCDLNFRIPDNTSNVSSNPSGSVSGKDLQWGVSLAGLEVKRYTVQLHLDTGKSKPGDSLDLHAWLENYGADDDSINNSMHFKIDIRAAYDPNSKHAVPEGDVREIKVPILYTVNFQNLGTDYARHVIVKDSIDATLSIESIEIIESSHPVKAKLENGILTFSFTNINLDYAAHDVEASKGWVSFRLKPVNGLLANTIIPNKAGIYFDFNSAIVTNTALIRLTEANSSGIATVKTSSGIKLYPNPAADEINIEGENLIGEVSIYSVHGVKVLSQQVNGVSVINLNIAELSPGIYILTIGKEAIKFIVE